MNEIINLIKQASLHKGASDGEIVTARFIQSCLNYTSMVNIKDVIYFVDIEIIKQTIDMAQSNALNELVHQYNNNLMK
jgi:hypothetical protein